MRDWHVPIPRLRMPFPRSSKRSREDPIEKEFLEFTKNLLSEMHTENMRLLRESLEEIRDRRQRKAQ